MAVAGRFGRPDGEGEPGVLEGKSAEAATLFKDAIARYARMDESTGTLNNAALCHFGLYYLTGETAEFARGVDKLDRAVALRPSDSILLNNAADMVLEGAIDLAALKRSADWGTLEGSRAVSRPKPRITPPGP